MANDTLVSEEFAKKFATEKETPYTRWVSAEGLDIISSFYVPNLHTVELKPWARRGGRGVFLNHDASRTSNDCYVCEIPPGKELAPQRQLYEEMILILDGRGSTSVWNDAGRRITFEWRAGSMFAIPLNAWHQHFNGSGMEPARYVAVTNAPVIINSFDDLDFVFNTRYDFTDRFNGEPDYFANRGEQKGLLLDTNFVPGRRQPPAHLREGARRRRLARQVQHGERAHEQPHLAVRGGHLQEGARARTRRPRHHPERRRFQPDVAGREEPQRFEWQEGSMIVPPNAWLHQHFNTGTTPGPLPRLQG